MDLARQPQRVSTAKWARWARSFLSRAFAGRGDRKYEDTKGPLGLTTLYEPIIDDTTVFADVIFVHGLNGGSQSTWSKGNNSALFWPKEWLTTDDAFRDVRIHTFGYPALVKNQSALNIHDFARSLLAAIKDSPVINKDTTVSTAEGSGPMK